MKGQNESFCSEKLKINQIGFLFTHKNGDFGAISVTERSWARRSLRLSVFTLYRILFIIAFALAGKPNRIHCRAADHS